MTIDVEEKDGKKVVRLAGRLDTNTAPKLEEAMKPLTAKKIDLAMDLSNLDYITSAGLRVFLSVHKKQQQAGKALTIHNANESVMEVFVITGLWEKLTFVSE